MGVYNWQNSLDSIFKFCDLWYLNYISTSIKLVLAKEGRENIQIDEKERETETEERAQSHREKERNHRTSKLHSKVIVTISWTIREGALPPQNLITKRNSAFYRVHVVFVKWVNASHGPEGASAWSAKDLLPQEEKQQHVEHNFVSTGRNCTR